MTRSNEKELLDLASKVLEGGDEHKSTRVEKLIDGLNKAADDLEHGVRVFFDADELREIAKYLEYFAKTH